jgi:pSer/pThr/pTyr-binding forkhead associated (FHA) protein
MMNMVPFLSVYKQGQLVDSICLQDKDTWIVGRHVDCDIHVAHASASRHHLEIQVLHATMELLLTDLQSGNVKDFLMRERDGEKDLDNVFQLTLSGSSERERADMCCGAVHGTRVNGEVVGTGQASCVVKQNDVIELGASTRVYKVEWLPAASSAAGTITEATQFSDEETSAAALSVESSTHSNAESIKILDQRLSPNRRSKIVSCKSLNHQENGLLNNRQQLRRENSSSAIQLVQDENAPSPARSSLQQAQQRSGSRNDLLPPRTPARRLAFASLEPSALNVRSPAAAAAMNPSLHMTPGKLTPTKLTRAAGAAPENSTKTQVLAETVGTAAEGSTPSKLWLRRCSSEPLPSIVTATAAKTASKTEKQTKPSEREEEEALSILNPELCNAHESIGSIESALRKLSMQSYESDGEESNYYPSDKENIQPPHEEQLVLPPSTSENFRKTLWSCEAGRDSTAVGLGSGMSGRSSSKAAADTVTREDINRRIPFQPLLCIQPMSSKAGAAAVAAYKPVFSPSTSTASSLDSDFGSRALGLPRPHHQGGASSSPKVWAMSHMCFHAIPSLSLPSKHEICFTGFAICICEEEKKSFDRKLCELHQ